MRLQFGTGRAAPLLLPSIPLLPKLHVQETFNRVNSEREAGEMGSAAEGMERHKQAGEPEVRPMAEGQRKRNAW